MYHNIYEHASGKRVAGGYWPSRTVADQMARRNESPTFRRVAVEELPDCDECEGRGTTTAYPGGFGSGSCLGPSERICTDCNGTGVSNHA